MKKTIFKGFLVSLLLLSFLISGCQQVKDWTRKEPINDTPINNSANYNYTEPLIETPQKILVENNTNIFIFNSAESCVFIKDMNGTTYLIDCGGDDILKVIKNLKKFEVDSIDYFYYTTLKKDMDLIVDKYKPSVIKQIDNFFLDKFFYSGVCVDDCEGSITYEDVPIMYLANNGLCPSNSFRFLIQINPEIIISNSLICEDLKEKILALEIPVYNKDTTEIHFVMNETDYWLR